MRQLGLVLVVACGTPIGAPIATSAPPVDREAWRARRPLPAAPTLVDAICVDGDDNIQLDVEPNPAAPTVTAIARGRVKVCTGEVCRELHVTADDGETVQTNGTYAIANDGVYRIADGKRMYDEIVDTKLDNHDDAKQFSCGTPAFAGDAILAAGHGCGGQVSAPFLVDAATGRTIAELEFANDDSGTRIGLRALHLTGARWAVVANVSPFSAALARNGWSDCGVATVDVRTGHVVEQLRCQPDFALVADEQATPVHPPACAERYTIAHAERGTLTTTFGAMGDYVRPLDHTDVTSPVAGVLAEIAVRPLDVVRKGQVLGVIESKPANGRAVRTKLVAPRDGVVVAPKKLERGQAIAPDEHGASPVVFAITTSLGQLAVTMSVTPDEVRRMQVGQHVEVYVEKLHNATFAGTVRSVGATRSTPPDHEERYPIDIVVDNPDRSLLPDMWATAIVTIRSAPNALVVSPDALTFHLRRPYDADDAHPDRRTVWLVRGGAVVPAEVKIGVIGIGSARVTQVEIVDGITDADALAMRPHDD